jgi:hypothetical protein
MLGLLTGGVGVLTRVASAAGGPQTTGAARVEKEKPREASGSNTITVKNMVVEKVDAAQQTLSVATPKQDTVAGTVLLDGGTVLLGGLKRIGEVGVVEIMSDGTLRRKQAPAKPDTLQDKSKESQPARSAPAAPPAKTEGTKGKPQEPAKKAPAQADTKSGAEPQQPLGYYPPAQALVVKGTSRVHTTMEGDSLRVLLDSSRSMQQKETKLEGLPVARDARIVIKGKPGKLADLRAGMRVTLELGADGGQVVVKSIKVEQ